MPNDITTPTGSQDSETEGNTNTVTSTGAQTQATQADHSGETANQSNQVTTRTFTQDDVNDIAGRARAQARRKLLEELGYEDLEAAQKDIAAYQKHRQSQMTELEQAQEQLGQLGNVKEQLQAAADENKALRKLIKAQVEAQIAQLEIPEHIKPLMAGMTLEDQLNYLNQHGAQFAVQNQTPRPPATNADGKGSGSDNKKTRMDRIRAKYSIN